MRNGREDLISKALDTIAGAALIPEQLNPVLTELAMKLNPLFAMLEKTSIAGDVYKFNQRTAYPSISSVSGEKANTQSGSSAYNRETVDLKVLKMKGGVTGFQKASSRQYIDSFKEELVGVLEKMMYDFECLTLYGDASADEYEFGGFESLLPLTSRLDGIGVISLDFLDLMIDRVIPKGGRGSKYVWVTSVSMLSKISSFQLKIYMTLKEVEAFGGWRFTTYRYIPFIESSFCAAQGVMGTIASSLQAGGTLADATAYHYRISVVTPEGESVASNTVTETTSSPNLTIQLTWTAYAQALHYKVFRRTGGAGNLTLLTTIAANTYDADGNVIGLVTSFDDDGSYTEDQQTLPLENNEESIFLVNLDKNKGCEIPYTNENASKNQIVTYEDMGKTDDKDEFLLKSYLAMAIRNPNLHIRARNVKTS